MVKPMVSYRCSDPTDPMRNGSRCVTFFKRAAIVTRSKIWCCLSPENLTIEDILL